MRLALLAAVAFLPALAGCLADDPLPRADAGAPTLPRACATGEGDLFLATAVGGGLAGPGYMSDLASIDRDGDLFRVSGRTRDGSGRIVAGSEDALANVTARDVRAELVRLGAFDATRDYVIAEAFRDRLPAADARDFCDLALDEFRGLEPRYDNPSCADGATRKFRVSTERGEHESSAYCDGGPPAFARFESAYLALEAGARERARAAGPA